MSKAPTKALSGQETHVLFHMSQGRTNRQVGERLGVGEETVKTVVRRVFAKLGAADRAHAVRRGFEVGLLKPYADLGDVTQGSDPLPRTALAVAVRETDPAKQLVAALESLGWTHPGVRR